MEINFFIDPTLSMIDFFSIFTKGGLVLWCTDNIFKPKAVPAINNLIRSIFMEGKSGSTKKFDCHSHSLEWVFDNELDLIFVCVYQQFVNLLYIDALLKCVKERFVSLFNGRFKSPINYAEFDKLFDEILQQVESSSKVSKHSITQNQDTVTQNQKQEIVAVSSIVSTENTAFSGSLTPPMSSKGKKPVFIPKTKPKNTGTTVKENRVWEDKYDPQRAKTLDYSRVTSNVSSSTPDPIKITDENLPTQNDQSYVENWGLDSNSDDEEEEEEEEEEEKPGFLINTYI
jgi:signal recognition particle receptor subunit alpha